MQVYKKVKIDPSANEDIDELFEFLIEVMSYEGARRYVMAMIDEVNSLIAFADCYTVSRSLTIKQVHPHARRMVSHNKKWVYVFHIETDTVVIDRILKTKMITR